MKHKWMIYCIFLSFLCWTVPFVVRLFFIDIPEIPQEQINNTTNIEIQNTVENVTQLLSENQRNKIFIIVFKQNIKSCVLNVAGGTLFGLGTLINLFFNGFYSADILVDSYNSGLDLSVILQHTLPHSFELIAVWLSGGIGFFIALNVIQFIKGKNGFAGSFYQQTGFLGIIILLVILLAAYVETYISLKFR